MLENGNLLVDLPCIKASVIAYFNLQSLLYFSCNILFSNCLSGHTISTYQTNMICGKPFSHHGTQTILPLLRMQVDANGTRFYAR